MTTATSHIHASRHKVTLPDGSRVDIRTKEGADDFLQKDVDFSRLYISNTLQDANAIREKPELDQEDKECIMQAYTLIHMVALNAAKPVFKEVMLESEIRVWFNLAIDELKQHSTKPSWTLTGILSEFDEAVIHPCVTLILHTVPVAIAFECGFFSAMADFIRARKGSGGGLPSPMICSYIASIMFYACKNAVYEFQPGWVPEKTFGLLDECGLLEQWLRVVTVPQFKESDILMSNILDMLCDCNDYFLSINFRRGTPCGDTVRKIIDGKDGSKVERPIVMTRLRSLAQMVDVSGQQAHQDFLRVECEYCGKSGSSMEFQKSLLTCSRCKQARYCSKECQRADWKKHKKNCAPPGSNGGQPKEQKPPASVEIGLGNFVLRNGKSIAVKLTETCERTGLTVDDMIVEVDFMPDAKGVIPAYQNPASFKIAPLQDYIDGTEVPSWVFGIQDPAESEKEKSNVISGMKGLQEMKRNNKKCMYLANCNGLKVVQVQTTDKSFMSLMLDAFFENFTKKHHQAILDKVEKECSKHKVEMKDLIMELDFVANKKGVVPAMQSPPLFKIVPAKRYMEKPSKSRTKDKDWFFNYQHPEIQSGMKKGAVQVVKETPREAGDLLCFLHFYGGLADRIFSQSNAMTSSATS